MAKKSKIKPTVVAAAYSHIKPTSTPEEKRVAFNFRRLQEKKDKFRYSVRDGKYFLVLLGRLRDISGMTRTELTKTNAGGLRCHPIDFSHDSVTENGFGVLSDLDEDAWQFQLSSNEHGRVHGYFVENVFHVIWLDPFHELYTGR